MPQFRSPTRRQLCRDLTLAATALLVLPVRAKAQSKGAKADRILVLKSERKLLLLRGENPLATFPVALGARPVGPKRRRGDARTPEGRYRIDGFNSHSRFYRALHISYPNAEDLRRARAAGLPLGGNIEIHGLPDGFGRYDPVAFYKDWTDGCIAVSNRAIDEIWASVGIGTPVDIMA
jgi:murein L,D-transpeptidase YafK